MTAICPRKVFSEIPSNSDILKMPFLKSHMNVQECSQKDTQYIHWVQTCKSWCSSTCGFCLEFVLIVPSGETSKILYWFAKENHSKPFTFKAGTYFDILQVPGLVCVETLQNLNQECLAIFLTDVVLVQHKLAKLYLRVGQKYHLLVSYFEKGRQQLCINIYKPNNENVDLQGMDTGQVLQPSLKFFLLGLICKM